MGMFNKVGVSFLRSNDFVSQFLHSSAIDGKKGAINEGKPQDGTAAQVTIIVDDDDFADLAAGKANAPAVCFP